MAIDSSSLERNLSIFQGDNFPFKVSYIVDGTPVDFTGWTGTMLLKKNFQDVTAALTLTTANGGIVWQDGELLITMTPTQTALLSQRYYYALTMTNPGGTERITPIFGQAIITPSANL